MKMELLNTKHSQEKQSLLDGKTKHKNTVIIRGWGKNNDNLSNEN